MVMEICKKKNFFVIKTLLSWEWYETFNKILHYKSFPLPQFNTTNQTSRYCISTDIKWGIEYLFINMKCLLL